LKYREEIVLDGADYARTKRFSKLFSNDDNDSLVKIISHLLTIKLIKSPTPSSSSATPTTQTHRDLILFSYLGNVISKLVLNQFKFCLLDMFRNVCDELKFKLLEAIFTFLMENLNDVDRNEMVNKNLVDVILNDYVIKTESAQFFIKKEKYFDYLIGYLNNANQTPATTFKMQTSLVKCCFDLLSLTNDHNKNVGVIYYH
jgi:hypothetical protein